MKAFVPFSSRSDRVILERLQGIEFVGYQEAEKVICIGDRKEIHEIATKAFLDHKYIIHLHAGVVSKDLATYDDYLRHCVSILSDEQWVESKECKRVIKKLFKVMGKKPNIKIVRANHLHEVCFDNSLVPEEPYNLVLYNPCTKIKEVFIGPNPDLAFAQVAHAQLMSLIEQCEKFYTNSSSGVYEAPFLIKDEQIIWLGKRNRGRKYV